MAKRSSPHPDATIDDATLAVSVEDIAAGWTGLLDRMI